MNKFGLVRNKSCTSIVFSLRILTLPILISSMPVDKIDGK